MYATSPLLMFALTAVIQGGYSQTIPCNDIDTVACQLMAQSNPSLCMNVDVAEAACPKFCNRCAKTCYICETPVRNAINYNNTAVCGKDERCYLRTLTSSTDGHVEYLMGCASLMECDGIASNTIIGKRDVSFHCCTDDYCNDPAGRHSTAAPAQTTASMIKSTTGTVTGCARDVLFMMSASTSISYTQSNQASQLMHQVIQHFNIGRNDSLFAFAVYDHDVHERWNFSRYQTKSDLLAGLSQTAAFSSNTNRIDYGDVVKYISHHKAFGYRPQITPKTVIFVDHNDLSHHHTAAGHYPQFGSDVIVVTIGIDENAESFSSLVPDPSHRLHVNGYSDLSSIESKLVSLICS